MCVKLKACAHFTARGLPTIYEQSNVTASSLRAANLIPNGYYNEACRPHQAAAALEWAEQRALCLSLPFCHQRTKDTKSFTNERSGVFGKQKKICCEVINNIQITLLIQVFLKPKYTLVPGLSVKMSASSMAHMQMQVVVSVLFIKRWIIVLRTWRLKTERLSCSGLAAECLKNINKLNHLNL